MHVLDFLMWIVLSIALWFIIDKLSDGEFTHELGAIGGCFIIIAFSILYLIVFAFYPNWNWVDIFKFLKDYSYNIDFKW